MSKLIPVLRGRGKRYKLLDRLSATLAAGSVNGKLAQPGPGGVLTVRDVENVVTVDGALKFGAQATPLQNDENAAYENLPITRAFGVIAIVKYRLTTANLHQPLAFVTGAAFNWNGIFPEAGFRVAAPTSLLVTYNNVLGPVVATIATATDYLLAIELRAAGAKWYIKGGAFASWTKLFEHTLGSTATLYIAAAGYDSVFSLDDWRMPSRLFKDAPLASDSFAGTDGTMDGRLTDGNGHPEANGGAGLAWTAPTWTIASNAAVNTPTQGVELLTDGGLENWASATNLTSWTEALTGTSTVNREATIIKSGTYSVRLDVDASNSNVYIDQTHGQPAGIWYSISFWAYASASGKTLRINSNTFVGNSFDPGSTWTEYVQIVRIISGGSISAARGSSSASSSLYFDSISAKPLTLSTLFSSLVLSTVNVMADCVIKTLVAGTQAGFVARLDSAASPANFVNGYWDGAGNIKVDECVAGVYTNLLNVVKAYATGDTIRPWLNASAWRLYHITAAGVVTLLGSGTTNVTTGLLFGKFSTYSGNAIESCNAYAVGVEGQYDGLNQF